MIAAAIAIALALAAGAPSARAEAVQKELAAVAARIEQMKANGVRGGPEIESLLSRAQMLAAELERLGGAGRRPAEPTAPGGDPQELRERADALRDRVDRLRGALAGVELRLREEGRRRRAGRLANLEDEGALFSESSPGRVGGSRSAGVTAAEPPSPAGPSLGPSPTSGPAGPPSGPIADPVPAAPAPGPAAPVPVAPTTPSGPKAPQPSIPTTPPPSPTKPPPSPTKPPSSPTTTPSSPTTTPSTPTKPSYTPTKPPPAPTSSPKGPTAAPSGPTGYPVPDSASPSTGAPEPAETPAASAAPGKHLWSSQAGPRPWDESLVAGRADGEPLLRQKREAILEAIAVTEAEIARIEAEARELDARP